MTKLTRTTNAMKALTDTGNVLTDLFFKVGSSRGKNLVAEFATSYHIDPEKAVRLALWTRDAREGAGERQMARDFLLWLEQNHPEEILETMLLERLVELGRWDDLLIFQTKHIKRLAYARIKVALDNEEGLAAKWMPRKGALAAELRTAFGWTPKYYRKRLVELTNVVETAMCSGDWTNIDFNKVPSLAMARYKAAFKRNAGDHFTSYAKALEKGVQGTKVNAGAVFPYDVLKGLIGLHEHLLPSKSREELAVIDAQWKALPNWMDEQQILPVVDVSGSMAGKEVVSGIDALSVAVSLGLYCSDKNRGPFKDVFATFSSSPELIILKGTITQKIKQMVSSNWNMSTNLHAVFDLILKVALKAGVPQSGMPAGILILSDMQFNNCAQFDDSAIEMIRRKYEAAGYKMPGVVFWNINAYDNVPVQYNERGVALVSGFSPTIMKSVLECDFASMTPVGVMTQTIMSDRYAYKK